MNIVTEFVYPPIPDRRFDWTAIDSDTYDGAPDSSCPIGRGPTEEAAIADLVEQFEERVESLETENQLLRAQLTLAHLKLQRQLRTSAPLSVLARATIANDSTIPALLRRQAE